MKGSDRAQKAGKRVGLIFGRLKTVGGFLRCRYLELERTD